MGYLSPVLEFDSERNTPSVILLNIQKYCLLLQHVEHFVRSRFYQLIFKLKSISI